MGHMAFKSVEVRVDVAQTRLKPEEHELARKQEEQAALQLELADRELRLANLAAELASFERRYLHFVASRYAELDEWKARSAEQFARQRPESERAQQAAVDARSRASETQSTATESGGGDEIGPGNDGEPRVFKASPEMKRLYREVARRVHPDLASDRDDRAKREQLMADANLAYERADEAKLERILAAYESSPESVAGDGPGAELIRAIRRVSQIRSRLAEIEAELQDLLGSDLYQLKARVDEAQQSGRDLIKEMVTRVEDQISLAKQRTPSPHSFAHP
jgi:hypothetical protein